MLKHMEMSQNIHIWAVSEREESMEENNFTKKIYMSYSAETDITTIFEDIFTLDGEIKSTEIKGFYFGKPTKVLTEQYYGKTKAVFCNLDTETN